MARGNKGITDGELIGKITFWKYKVNIKSRFNLTVKDC